MTGSASAVPRNDLISSSTWPIFKFIPNCFTIAIDLGELRLCHLLLHKNASVPWLILVPETLVPGDLLDLPKE